MTSKGVQNRLGVCIRFEEKLREVDPTVSLPYWDYTMDYYLPCPIDSVIWSPCFVGNPVGRITDGPFQGYYGGLGINIVRNAAKGGQYPPRLINKNDIKDILQYCYYKVLFMSYSKLTMLLFLFKYFVKKNTFYSTEAYC